MTIADIKKTAEHKMQQSIESFKGSLGKVRTGRANPQLLDTVHVDYYGSMLPLSQVPAGDYVIQVEGKSERKPDHVVMRRIPIRVEASGAPASQGTW